MSRSDRDPLFFPPQKYGEEPEPEVYSVDVDTEGQQRKLRALIAIAAAVLVIALAFLESSTLQTLWLELKTSVATALGGAPPANAPLDSLPVQLQAQRLLQRAASNDAGALAEIDKRLPGWRGKLQLDDALWSALATASDSRQMPVRVAAVEVDLVARHIEKTPAMVDRLIGLAAPGQNNRPAALWGLGELANRGVEPDRARQGVTGYLHDPQEEIRFWATSSLAMTGQDEAIPPLLESLRHDSSARIRENAARALAVGGMFTPEQRMQAVPELLNDAADAGLDPATRTWVFHALRDITGQSLPDDAAAWRQWYAKRH